MDLISWWKVPPVLVLCVLSILFSLMEDVGYWGNRRCEDLIASIRGR